MRRPLVLGSLLFAVILFIALQVRPLWWGDKLELPEEDLLVRGRIVDKEYKYSDDKFVLILYLDQCELLSFNAEASFELMCYLDEKCDSFRDLISFEEKLGNTVALGSRVTLGGKMRGFESATNEGQFDSKKYYQILGIGGCMFSCTILDETRDLESSGLWYRIRNELYEKKRFAALLLYSALEKEDASVMCSMMLGQKALLDSEVKDLYKQSGIIHILAISGLHISLFGMSIFKALRSIRVGPLISGTISSTFVILYGVMVGFGPSSLRAILMFLLQMLACAIGRTYDLLTGLSLAAVVILFMQPLFLYHSGFLLSFACVASIALLTPVMETLFPRKLSPGCAIFFGTLPVHGLFYYQIAPYALLLNLLVVPNMAMLLILGILLLIVGSCSLQFMAYPAAPIAWILHAFSKLSELSLSLPGKQWIIGKPAILEVLLYLTVLVIVYCFAKEMPRLWHYMMLLIAMGVLCRNWNWGLQVSFLDVGQGDGIYVTDHRGTHVLIDGGSSSVKEVGSYRMLPFLKSQGVSKLDAVFISHLDEDHYNGILELIELSDDEGVEIDAIYYTGLVATDEKEKEEELCELTQRHHIRLEHLYAGMTFEKGRLHLECIYPGRGQEADSSNENSMVLLLKYGNKRGLFTGDLEGLGERETEERLQQKKLGPLDFLKVAHHGSKNSTADTFLKIVQPKATIISAGKDNRYGHPHEETLQRIEEATPFSTLLRTDQCGQITFTVTTWGRGSWSTVTSQGECPK